MNIIVVGQGAMGLLWYHHLAISTAATNLSLLASTQHNLDDDNYYFSDHQGLAYQGKLNYAYDEEIKNADVILVPRVNTVEGLEQSHIDKWKWNVNDKGWVNFPDYQTRIYRNTEDVTWMNKVHERITGYDTFSNFPAEEQWSLYHHKQIDRQEKQNEFYETI